MNRKILFIGGYNSQGRKADSLEKKGFKVYRLLPDYDEGLNKWIDKARKIITEKKINEVHASSTGAQVACLLNTKKILYSPVIDPFNQPKQNIFSDSFLNEATVIKKAENCQVIIPENDEVLDNEITLEFCRSNNIRPIISRGDYHGLTKYFGGKL